MTEEPVRWSDAAEEVFEGDLTVAAAYVTPAGGAAPPKKNLLLVSNGLMAKVGAWQAGRSGAAERLRALQVAAGGTGR